MAACGFTLSARSAELDAIAPEAAANAPIFKSFSDLKWDKILPDLGADSPDLYPAGRSEDTGDQLAHSHAESDPRSQALAQRQ